MHDRKHRALVLHRLDLCLAGQGAIVAIVGDLQQEIVRLQVLRARSLDASVGTASTAIRAAFGGDLATQFTGEGGLKGHVKVAMSRLERELVSRALQQTTGNVTHAARLLKISRKGLQLKMKELGLREAAEKVD